MPCVPDFHNVTLASFHRQKFFQHSPHRISKLLLMSLRALGSRASHSDWFRRIQQNKEKQEHRLCSLTSGEELKERFLSRVIQVRSFGLSAFAVKHLFSAEARIAYFGTLDNMRHSLRIQEICRSADQDCLPHNKSKVFETTEQKIKALRIH